MFGSTKLKELLSVGFAFLCEVVWRQGPLLGIREKGSLEVVIAEEERIGCQDKYNMTAFCVEIHNLILKLLWN